MIYVNGKEQEYKEETFLSLVKDLELPRERIALECNGEIIKKEDYSWKVIKNGDCIEIINFVGGG